MSTTVAAEARSQYLSFFLSGEEYGVSILRVKEILEYDVPTRVPGMPASIVGVINVRGRVVPIIDLAVRFGLPSSTVTRRSCIVVVELTLDGERMVMGLIADAVSQVLDLAVDAIEPPPSFGTSVRADYLEGMAQTGEGRKFVMLLDIDRALSVQGLFSQLAAHESARQPDVAAPAPESSNA